MAGADPVLAAWQAAGTDLTMLPSGMEFRLEPIPVTEMIRSGSLPGSLRALAVKFGVAEMQGETVADLNEEELHQSEQLTRQLIARWVSGARWTCDCPQCMARRTEGLEPFDEIPYQVSVEDLAADPPRMARVDLAALEDIVNFLRSPKEVDALSRVMHGQMDPETAARIADAEKVNTIAGWGSFRGGGRVAVAGARAGVRRSPFPVPGANRAARRAADRRGARPPRPAGAGDTPKPAGP